ncbi:MAG: (2Fe-2S)-binding protein [bacterium]|nr:MAG: (2Fe-2S)-binding protein [bacterium]
MKELITFNLNRKPVELNLDRDRILLWVLRTDLGLTGTKYGCGESYCGACTVLVDDEALRSCQITLNDIQNRSVVTIEGLANNGELHPLQKAFMENDALQCGYCTPGMIMNAYALLKKNPDPTEKQIMEGMEENLCRCGAYKRIVEAIQAAARVMGGFEHEKK